MCFDHRRANGSHGFIPANYVQEIEHKLVSIEVKKPVVIKDVKKVKKIQYVKQQATPAASQRSGWPFVPFLVRKKMPNGYFQAATVVLYLFGC